MLVTNLERALRSQNSALTLSWAVLKLRLSYLWLTSFLMGKPVSISNGLLGAVLMTGVLCFSSSTIAGTGSGFNIEKAIFDDPLIASARSGDSRAQYMVAKKYRDGNDGVSKSDTQAIYWYQKSAAQGFGPAQIDLGQMYVSGRGVKKDYSQAIVLFQRAALQGHAVAQFNLANMYRNGMGLQQNFTKSVEFYRQAAEGGFVEAQYNLALMYYYGKGAKRDFSQVLHWYTRAAKQGFIRAQFYLGNLYEEGETVVKDMQQAYRWYSLAAQGGSGDAYASLQRIAAKMSDADILSVQREVMGEQFVAHSLTRESLIK